MKKTELAEISQCICDSHGQGISIAAIAKRLNINSKTVSSILKKNGIKTRRFKDLTNLKFGRLTVIREFGKGNKGQIIWLCSCECGNDHKAMYGDLKSGDVKSCGCLRAQITTEKNIERCSGARNNKTFVGEISDTYYNRIVKNASARSLEVNVSRQFLWDLFLKQNKKCALSGKTLFFNDVGIKNQTASIDRIDSTKGYVENNVQWVHKDINFMKSNHTDEEFKNLCHCVSRNDGKVKNKVLYRTRTYLAGNLECTEDEYTWRKKYTEFLEGLGVIVFDPTRKCFLGFEEEKREERFKYKEMRKQGEFDKLSSIFKEIIAKDLRCVDISDFCIFRLEPDKPTWGTTHELVVASSQKKPILIVTNDPEGNFPLWFTGLVNPKTIFKTDDELFEYLTSINNGEVELERKIWRLLEVEYR